MTPTVHYAISWDTRDRRLIHRVCSYLGVRPQMNINRMTHIGQITDEQRQALQPLVDSGNIRLVTFRD